MKMFNFAIENKETNNMKRTIITFVLAVVTMMAMGQEKEPFFRTDSAFIVGKIVGGDSFSCIFSCLFWEVCITL